MNSLDSRNMIKILYYTELAIISLSIIILPFYDTKILMKSYLTEKSFLFFGILCILLVSYSIRVIISPKLLLKLKITWLDILLFAFFVFISLNRHFVSHIHGYTLKYLQLTGLVILFLIVRSFSPVYQKYLIVSILISGILQAVYGNLQLYNIYPSKHHLFSITGSFFNPGPYAGYLAMVFPIALVIYFTKIPKIETIKLPVRFLKKFKKSLKQTENNLKLPHIFQTIKIAVIKYISLITIITILLVLPATRSRAAWLATIISSGFVVFRIFPVRNVIEKFLNSGTKRLIAGAVILFFVSGFVTSIYLMKKDSADGRLLIWKNTSRMIKDKPFAGHGYGKFQAHYMDYQAEYFQQNPDSKEGYVADNIIYPFNEYLKVLSELGIIGFILLIIIPLCLFRTKSYNNGGRTLYILITQASILSLCIFSFFSYPAEILPILINMMILLAIASSHQERVFKKPMSGMTSKIQAKTPMILNYTIAGVSLFIILLTFKPIEKLYKAYWTWDEAFKIYQMGLYDDSIESFQNSYIDLKNNGEFLVMYGKALSMAGKNQQAVELLNIARNYLKNTILYTALGDSYKELQDINKSEEAYLKAYYMIPNRFYPKYLLAKLYQENGQYIKANRTALELLNKNEKIHSTAIEEIREEMEAIIDKNKNISE